MTRRILPPPWPTAIPPTRDLTGVHCGHLTVTFNYRCCQCGEEQPGINAFSWPCPNAGPNGPAHLRPDSTATQDVARLQALVEHYERHLTATGRQWVITEAHKRTETPRD